jgi:chromatin remodeling complex protein RSC6
VPVAPAAAAPAASGAGAAESSSDESVSEIDALKARLTAALEAVRTEKARLQEVGKTLVSLVEGLVRDTNTVLRKSLRRKRRTGTSNANSGFLKPKLVTQELCAFLERPAGTQMSRTEVTRSICDYIKRNELQDKKNRRIIVPDQRLSGLLKLEKGQTLTYFDLQSKMNHLFAVEETA